MKHFLILAFALISAAPAQAENAAPEAEVLAVLESAEAAWNAGDLEGYMQSYWNSDRLRFAGADHVRYGWEETLAAYRRGYPDAQAMGHLTFSGLEVTVLADDAALVFGAWRLDREGEAEEANPHGLFTLLVRRLPEGWRITHDHTSSG